MTLDTLRSALAAAEILVASIQDIERIFSDDLDSAEQHAIEAARLVRKILAREERSALDAARRSPTTFNA
jgi:hypothetical protein